MTEAVAGHGATIAMETPPGSGTFVTIAELNGDIQPPELNRPETNVTPHQDNIDSWVLGILQRGPFNFGVNYIFDNPTHDHSSGLLSSIIGNEFRGFRYRGPQGSEGTDEWITSGQVQAITFVNPVREGARSSEVTIRLSGPMIIDGEEIGTPTP